MNRLNPRQIWLALAVGGMGAALFSFGLTEWRYMDACHLCIFQRLLFMILGVLALGAAIGGPPRLRQLLGAAVLLTATTGLGVAAYQSWLQLQATDSLFACSGAEPGFIEQWVDWLGQRWPTLFMATGLCNDAGLTFFGLTLANWAAAIFAVALGTAGWALWQSRSSVRPAAAQSR